MKRKVHEDITSHLSKRIRPNHQTSVQDAHAIQREDETKSNDSISEEAARDPPKQRKDETNKDELCNNERHKDELPSSNESLDISTASIEDTDATCRPTLATLPIRALKIIFDFIATKMECICYRLVCQQFNHVLWHTEIMQYSLDDMYRTRPFILAFKIMNIPYVSITLTNYHAQLFDCFGRSKHIAYSLKSLTIDHNCKCKILDVSVIKGLSQLKSLQYLEIKSKLKVVCRNFREWDLLTEKYTNKLYLPQLKTLNLNVPSCNFILYSIVPKVQVNPIPFDLVLQATDRLMPKSFNFTCPPLVLQSLSTVHIPMSIFQNFIRASYNLKVVSISLKVIPKTFFINILPNLKHLESLKLSGKMEDFQEQFKPISSLKSLNIADLEWTTPEVCPLYLAHDNIEELSVSVSPFPTWRKKFPHLHTLSIRLYPESSNFETGSKSLFRFLLTTANIECLSLHGDELFFEILKVASTIPTLRTLKVYYYKQYIDYFKRSLDRASHGPLSLLRHLENLSIGKVFLNWDNLLFWQFIAPNLKHSLVFQTFGFPFEFLCVCYDKSVKENLFILMAVMKKLCDEFLQYLSIDDRKDAKEAFYKNWLNPMKDLYNSDSIQMSLMNLPRSVRRLVTAFQDNIEKIRREYSQETIVNLRRM